MVSVGRVKRRHPLLLALMGPYPHAAGNGGTTTDYALRTADGLADCTYVPDMVENGNRAVGFSSMRNWAAAQALDNGYDGLFLVENDVLLNEDTLGRLTSTGKDVVSPRLDYPSFPPVSLMCFGPQPHTLQTGLWRLAWSALSALLFSRSSLERLGGVISEPEEGDEGRMFRRWRDLGVEAWVDLDTRVDVLDLPTGHAMWDAVPFNIHYDTAGRECGGQLQERYRSEQTVIWACRECPYMMVFEMGKWVATDGGHRSANPATA